LKRHRDSILLALVLAMGIPGASLAHGHGGGGGHFGGGYYGGGHFGGGHFGRGYYGGGYRGYGGFGFYYAQPWYSPWYYGLPGYYYPYLYPSIMEPATPPVYIEQGGTQQPATGPDWKYCENPQGYYPFIKACEVGWQTVAPQPSGRESNYWYFCDDPKGYYPYVRECATEWQAVKPQSEPNN
jgi:hypothetical protein